MKIIKTYKDEDNIVTEMFLNNSGKLGVRMFDSDYDYQENITCRFFPDNNEEMANNFFNKCTGESHEIQ